MAKSTITREQLEEWVAQFDEDGGCDATDRQLEALIRQSLAVMDGEPVAEVLSNRPGNDTSTIDRALPVGTQLYRHAQQPVVPDEVTDEDCPALVKYDVTEVDEAWARGFNSCRGSMLQAGNSPTQSQGWIPLSEQMPPSRHEVLVGCWWGEKPRWCCKWAAYIPGHPDAQSSGWLIPGASWTPTHWMPLPAAPQEGK
ncbi:DUF551 domain-containing protein [Klebsiella quasipneumoniae]|uniref:DUF551 domain-containing protein n=1 Tax=Klebsiella quasipneumoniae TaxID=1463165 RepID=UPI0031E27DE0